MIAGFCSQVLTLSSPAGEASGEQVVAGSATFQRSGDNLTVTTGSNRTIINWNGFGVPNGSLTRFIQPGANSAVLNRVTGALPSHIDGALASNGRVYLINPNGIVVGPTGTINTAGFVASTLDVANQEFLAGGSLAFSGPSDAAVVNLGAIYASSGDIVMIARRVENGGTLSAPHGTVALGAGAEILLMETGLERIAIRPSGAAAGGTGVLNTGSINALAAELKANGNMYALAINTQGVIRATGAENVGGRVILRADGGKIAASGGRIEARRELAGGRTQGGVVEAYARDIRFTGATVVDVSGSHGGGEVMIGGDVHGEGSAAPNAELVAIGELVRIHADAIDDGKGGKVAVWSDDYTAFDGAISARGGVNGGDGGFVETSGKLGLSVQTGAVDTRANLGQTGMWLLDPTNIIVATGGGATTTQVDQFGDAGVTLTIAPATLVAAASNITLQATNDITFSNTLTLTAPGAGITAQAGNNINVNAAITTVGGAITLTAN